MPSWLVYGLILLAYVGAIWYMLTRKRKVDRRGH